MSVKQKTNMPPQFTIHNSPMVSPYSSVMPDSVRRGARLAARTAAGIGIGLAGIIAVQVAYPRSYTTPLLRVNNVAVGAKSPASLERTLQALNDRTVTLQARTKSYTTNYAELGTSVDVTATTKLLQSYSWRERLTPFSLFRRQAASTLQLRHDDKKLRETAIRIQQENALPAANATVERVKDEYVVAKASENGVSYDIDEVVKTLQTAQPGTTVQVALPEVTVEPAVTTEVARTTITQLKRQTTQATYLVINDKKFLIPQNSLKQFVSISYDKKRSVLQSAYNKPAIARYVAGIAPEVYVSPVASTVRIHDGVTIKTTPARDGQQLNEPETVSAIVKGLQTDQQSIVVKTQVISVSPEFSRSYSKSNKGLQILLQDWQGDTGLRAGVVVRELSGSGRSASINGSEQFLLASISKLYLEHYLYDGVAKGKWSMNDKLGADRSLSSCLEVMIVYSNNPCFNAIGANRGWNNVASFASASGFSSTNPNPGIYTSSAQDTAWFLQRLQSGTLLKSAHRKLMLSHMSRQIYREGIPSGGRGSVANKVGYYGGYRHDAGIVYHPKSTYVLVVFTYGGSPSQIADLARRVSKYMDHK